MISSVIVYLFLDFVATAEGYSYHAILKGVNNAVSLIDHVSDVAELPLCAKLCEKKECVSFAYTQAQKSCKTYSKRHSLSNNPSNDGYTYFQKKADGENTTFARLAPIFIFNDRVWTVVQRRFNGNISFDNDWNAYKNGFGDPLGEFWIGLELMHQLTASGPHSLLVLVESWKGVRKYAQYDNFELAPETDNYRLNVTGYSGTAGDCLNKKNHNHMQFSTKDKDNDLTHNSCADAFKSGFWFASCSSCNINGPWKPDTGINDRWAVVWYTYDNRFRPMKKAMMMMSCL
ncbi:angiopoietin-related protein 6-like [Ylistrum balloti]|uniref:angiopoietin-related protein 6-like n=1 Tax=Ylistrum balloti TaxID=509963 RepID=UPI002905C228|nr:angiopoietin-related protein 6-like [Ylistrum balloti]